MSNVVDERLNQLTPAKRALLRRMLAKDSSKRPPLTSRDAAETSAPLSFAQLRMWFLDQLEPRSSSNHISAAVQLDGDVQVPTLEFALNQVVSRHESLRSRFVSDGGEPRQEVLECRPVRLQVSDFPDELSTRQFSKDFSRRPFDLSEDPLLRVALSRISDDRHILVIVMHHIISDGWSMGIFQHEVAEYYRAELASETPRLHPLNPQFADFTTWQRNWLRDDVLEEQLVYWRKKLGSDHSPLAMPVDDVRPVSPSHRGDRRKTTVGAELTARLETLAAQHGSTLFMVLLAAWKIVLYRYSGQSRIRVGSPVANRRPAEVEPLIGLFVNTLVLQSDLTENLSFCEFLQSVRQTTLQAFDHQDVPFDRLVDDLRPTRDLSHAPLVQTLFVLQNTPRRDGRSARLNVTNVELAIDDSSAYDMTLNVTPSEEGLELLLVYATDLFRAETVERWLESLVTVLAAVAADPQQEIRDISVIGSRQRDLILNHWNDTTDQVDLETPVHQAIAKRAAQQPTRVAVEMSGREISYRQLDEQANQLAHYLLELGIPANQPVAICLPRSPESIMAMLAVMKTGAPYLPIDPTVPASRIRFMLNDSAASVVVNAGEPLPAEVVQDRQLVHLDELAARLRQQPISPVAVKVSPGDVAYAIYTSGSTGQPKAVAVLHRGLSNHVPTMAKEFGLEAGDRRAQFLSLSFDASGEEIFPALFAGATLVMHPSPRDLCREELGRFCLANKIQAMTLLPAIFNPIVESLVESFSDDDREWLDHLKTVMIGGDRVPPATMRRWLEMAHDSTRTLFLYGVTEATITSTMFELPQDFDSRRPIPIGRPIANHRVYVLDDSLCPVPVGAEGGLYIGGIGVAKGYLNRSELTKQRFVEDPFVTLPAQRMYATGDRARWRSDGQIEFMGRNDDQLKIRGYRIEAGEVEQALVATGQLLAAKVVARGDKSGHKRLVAYVVHKPNCAPTSGELKTSLARRLPAHMTPAVVVELDQIPLAPGGKIDEDALPVPSYGQGCVQDTYVAPRNAKEATLAEVWTNLLGVERVGVHDNFFELGGDSIVSLQMASRALAAGLRVSPKQLFQYQTIADLASIVEEKTVATAELLDADHCELNPIQRQFFSTALANQNHFGQSILLELPPDVSHQQLQVAWRAVLARHEALSSRFVQRDGEWHQLFDRDMSDQREVECRQLDSTGADDYRARVASFSERAASELDIASGPVAKAVLFEGLSIRDRRLLLTAHHLVVDGVSWRTIIEDLRIACQCQLDGRPVALAGSGGSLAGWSRYQQQAARDPSVESAKEYWLDWPDASTLPKGDSTLADTVGDDMAGDNRHGQSRSVTRQLDIETTSALLNQAQVPFRTKVDEFLLAALGRAVTSWSGSKELRVDIERHGRELDQDHGSWSRTVGWFTAAVPARIELCEESHAVDALKATKDQLRSIPGGANAFGLLRWIAVDEEISRQFPTGLSGEISFNYLGQLDAGRTDQSLFQLATESTGRWTDEQNPRWHHIDVVTMVQNGQLHVELVYSESRFSAAEMEQFADGLLEQIQDLVAVCVSSAAGVTASDFPLARLDSHQTTELESRLRQLTSLSNVTDVFPLTPMQQLMLLHTSAIDPSNMCEQFSCRLRGKVDELRLQAAWQEVLRRHAALRTGVLAVDPRRPIQFVLRRVTLPWTVRDLRDRACQTRAMEADRLRRAELDGGFDLDHPPLMRVQLVRMADDQWQMIWTVHHLVTDGWSAARILGELFTFYRSLQDADAPRLPASAEFSSYVRWLDQRSTDDAREFWQSRLAHATTTRVAGPMAAGGDGQHREVEVVMDATQKKTLDEFCTRQRITLSSVVSSAWALVLAKRLRRDDVVFGMTVSARPTDLDHAESIVGPFANNIPVRTTVDERRTVGQWLQDNLSDQLQSQPYEYSPLIDIANWSKVSGGRFFDSLLVMENYPLSEERRVDADLVVGDVHGTATSGLPLMIVAFPGAELTIRMRYSVQVLTAEIVEEMADQIQSAIHQLIGNVERKVGDLPLLAGWQSHRARFDRSRASLVGALAAHPLVVESHIVPWSDPDGDPGVAVYVVPTVESRTIMDGSQSLVAAKIREALVQLPETNDWQLAVVTLNELPRLPGGQVDDSTLPRPSRPRPDHAPKYIGPGDHIEESLARIWSELLGVHPIGVRDQFMAFGGDSSLAVNLVARIEQDLDRRIPLVALFQDPTIEYLAELIRRPVADKKEHTLVPIRPNGSRAPLYCIHPAGGTVFCYLNLANHLSIEQPVYGLQAVGVDGTRAPHKEVTEMAAHYVDAIRQQQPSGPYSICGWSSGGVVAFEVASQLQRSGAEIDLLLLFDAAIRAGTEYSQADFLPMLMMMFPGESREQLEEIQGRSFAEQLRYFQKRAESANLVMAGAENSQIKNVYDVFQANVNAMSTYRPQRFDGSLTLLRASDHATPMHEDPQLGWSGLADEIVILDADQDHVSMFSETGVCRVAGQVETLLLSRDPR